MSDRNICPVPVYRKAGGITPGWSAIRKLAENGVQEIAARANLQQRLASPEPDFWGVTPTAWQNGGEFLNICFIGVSLP
jgi:hypothetical protein